MSAQGISRWHEIADEVGLEFEDGEAPQLRVGAWTRALSRFTRQSFARVFYSPFEEEASIFVEIALGPPGKESGAVAEALRAFLARVSQSTWSAETKDLPWRFETSLESNNNGVERFARLLKELVAITERFESVSSAKEWLEILVGSDDEPAQSQGSAPFEEIGASTSATSQERATLSATALERRGSEIRIAIGFPTVIPPTTLDKLTRGLADHLHTKFEVQARPAQAQDISKLPLPSSTRTTAQIVVESGEYGGSLGALAADLEAFLERLEKFSAHGVDLAEYLGVDQRAFPRTSAPISRSTPEQRGERFSALSVAEADDQPVVLGLSEQSTSSGSLRPGDFEDPRLRQQDATTALVDLVLRHPGYSDRRIGQVLSILLSIDYHQAVALAERAPCVIAWSVGQERALSFKEVIESSGGKALLVEPGTF